MGRVREPSQGAQRRESDLGMGGLALSGRLGGSAGHDLLDLDPPLLLDPGEPDAFPGHPGKGWRRDRSPLDSRHIAIPWRSFVADRVHRESSRALGLLLSSPRDRNRRPRNPSGFGVFLVPGAVSPWNLSR